MTSLGSPILPPPDASRRSSGFAEFVLGRLGTGAGPNEAAGFDRIGYAAWLDQQLNPPKGDDSATAQRLAKAALRIK